MKILPSLLAAAVAGVCGAAQALAPVSRLPVVELQAPNVDAALAKAAQSGKPAPLLVGLAIQTDLTPATDGQWQLDEDGTAVWRIVLRAEAAQALAATLRADTLPDSARILAYAPDGSQTRGPYAAADFTDGVLAMPLIAGETSVVEVRVSPAQRAALSLAIRRVDYAFRDLSSHSVQAKFDTAGQCNVDVACPAGNAWRDQIRSVARYTVQVSNNLFLCSGQLVNNTAQDLTPYFLTADHCFRNPNTGAAAGSASSVVVYWNYQAANCGGTAGNSALNQNQTGATLLARSDGLFAGGGSDFLLLRLNAQPAAAFNVHYAGWDNRNLAPNGATAIHHPRGDQKAISVEQNQTTITDYSSNTTDPNSRFIRIADWDVGVTEQGSSGGGLWDNAGHRLVGTLSGGAAACNGSVDNNQPDWFGRMYAHFFTFNGSSNSLKPWLDPGNTGAATLDGIDPGQGTTDTTPNAFDLGSRNGVEPDTLVTSDAITVSGINAAAPVSVSGGQYSVNGGAFTAASGSVNNGDVLRVQLRSGAFSQTVTATLTIGGVSDSFAVTTRAEAAAGGGGGGGALGLWVSLPLLFAARRRHWRGLCAALLASSLLVACQCTPESGGTASAPAVAGQVTDMQMFERYIATRPTPAEFRAHYPDVQLVLPGDIATKEFRTNNSRYFAELDDAGRIIGGHFG